MNYNYNQFNIDFEEGTVIIAGSGPGAIKLTTYNVICAIQVADIIIYDALVNKSILRKCKKDAKLIFAGKLKEKRACSQKEINEWMYMYAKKKLKVLRLKGGDPSFFSRVSQEASYLKNKKIKFQIFSGITSSQISLKNADQKFFGSSNTCTFLTGHKSISSSNIKIDYKNISNLGGKIVIYMGVGQIKNISKELINNGIKKNVRVIIICNASLPNEKILETTLLESPALIKKKNVKSPAIIIVG